MSTPESTIIIAGSGRGGTTWMLDILAEANRLRTVFEPLHPIANPTVEPLAHRYLTADEDSTELSEFMDRVFSGEFHSIWSDFRIRPDKLLPSFSDITSLKGYSKLLGRYKRFARQLHRFKENRHSTNTIIVKFIRANLMLDWLNSRYPAQIIFLVRHPAAVVESRLRLGGKDWDYRPILARYQADLGLRADFLGEYQQIFGTSISAAKAHAIIWCIENCLPIRQAGEGNYQMIHYEHLLQWTQADWQQFAASLGLRSYPTGTTINQPSQQSADKRKNRPRPNPSTPAWITGLTDSQKHDIDQVLEYFGVDLYTVDNPFPLSNNPQKRPEIVP